MTPGTFLVWCLAVAGGLWALVAALCAILIGVAILRVLR